MAPATIGLMATQVNIFVSSSFASAEDGAVTWLNVAFRLIQLPIGMFGVAVGTVALARFSQSAAEADLGAAMDGVRDTLRAALRMVAFLTLPTTVGLCLLDEPIIAAIYQHGAFRGRDTLAAAAALRYYGIGLVAYAAVKVAAPVFYALGRVRVPVMATLLAVAANVICNVALHPRYGYRALALGTSLAALCNLAVLLGSFQRGYGGLWRQDVVLPIFRMAAAAGIMGGVVWGLDRAAAAALAPLALSATGVGLLRVCVAVPAGGAVYAGACWVLGVAEVGAFASRVSGRLRRA